MSISCYQFMFLLGVIDMITVPCNTIIYGIQGMLGVHYCQYPRFFYIVGCTSVADTPIVYMLFNVTLRKAVMSYIKDFFVEVGRTPVRMVTSIYNPIRVTSEIGLSRPI
uniref:G-protein coupled receptors family 1 profile domain-containing protein n=1 Tax=Acrobeloides nanus TaxID=290746 RepID=A0A914DRE9_9BILA